MFNIYKLNICQNNIYLNIFIVVVVGYVNYCISKFSSIFIVGTPLPQGIDSNKNEVSSVIEKLLIGWTKLFVVINSFKTALSTG